VAQSGVAGARRQDDLGSRGTNVCGIDDLVGVACLEDAVLVDAGRVREGVGTDDGLVGLDGHASDALHEVRGAGELGRDDTRVRVELLPHASVSP